MPGGQPLPRARLLHQPERRGRSASSVSSGLDTTGCGGCESGAGADGPAPTVNPAGARRPRRLVLAAAPIAPSAAPSAPAPAPVGLGARFFLRLGNLRARAGRGVVLPLALAFDLDRLGDGSGYSFGRAGAIFAALGAAA